MSVIDDLPKVVKALFGSSVAGTLDPAVLKQLDDLVVAGKGNIEEAITKLKGEGKLSKEMEELFDKDVFKSIIKHNRLELFGKFIKDFDEGLDGAATFTDAHRQDLLTQLVFDAKLAKHGDHVDLNNTRFIGNLVKDTADSLALRQQDLIKMRGELITDAMDQGNADPILLKIDALARKEFDTEYTKKGLIPEEPEANILERLRGKYASQEIDQGTNEPLLQRIDSISRQEYADNVAEARRVQAAEDAAQKAKSTDDGAGKADSGETKNEPEKPTYKKGQFAGEPTNFFTRKLSNLFNKIAGNDPNTPKLAKAAPTNSAGEIKAADTRTWMEARVPKWVPVVGDKSLFSWNIAAWRGYVLDLKDPIATVKNAVLFRQMPHLGVPRFGLNIGERYIAKRVKNFDTFLDKTGAFRHGAKLESDLKELTHALETKGTFRDEVITPQNFGDKFQEIFLNHASDPRFRESMELMRGRLVALQKEIDDIKVVDPGGKKYGKSAGLLETNQENMQRWVTDQIDTIDNILETDPSKNMYLQEMLREFQKSLTAGGGGLADGVLRETIGKTAFTMVDDRIGRRLGSWHAWRKYGRDLAVEENGAFKFSKSGNPMLGGDVTKLDEKHLILNLERGAYNEFTRIKPPESTEDANMGEVIHKAMNLFENLLEPDGKSMKKNWDTDSSKAQADALLNQLNLGHRGDNTACINSDMLTLRATKYALDAKNIKLEGLIKAEMKNGDQILTFEDRAINNVLDRVKYKLDGGKDFEIRDTAYRHFYEKEFDNFINIAERGQPRWPMSTILNPLKWWEKALTFNNRSSASYQFLQDKLWDEGKRIGGWLTGADIKYFGKLEDIGEKGKYFDPNNFELDYSWKSLIKAPVRILTAPLQLYKNMDWRLTNTFVQIKPTKTAMQVGGVYAGYEGVKSIASYAGADSDERAGGWEFTGQLIGNAIVDTFTPITMLVSEACGLADKLTDEKLGDALRAVYGEDRDMQAFWKRKFGVDSEGGIPYRDLFDAVMKGENILPPEAGQPDQRFLVAKIVAEAHRLLDAQGDDIHLNAKGKARVAREEAAGVTLKDKVIDSVKQTAQDLKEEVIGVDAETQQLRDLMKPFNGAHGTQNLTPEEAQIEALKGSFNAADPTSSTNLMRHYNLMSGPNSFVAGGNTVTPADDYQANKDMFLQALAS